MDAPCIDGFKIANEETGTLGMEKDRGTIGYATDLIVFGIIAMKTGLGGILRGTISQENVCNI